MTIDAIVIQKRLDELLAAEQETVQQLRHIEGAIFDCKFWLNKAFEEPVAPAESEKADANPEGSAGRSGEGSIGGTEADGVVTGAAQQGGEVS